MSQEYAGASPITPASGTKKAVLACYVRNRRLADAIYLWAFASLSSSPGARAYYDARRAYTPSATAWSACSTAASLIMSLATK